ncbi:hypothetical protein [Nocardioides sp.]|uniref:hypothetical protein n=1 Tax=Nocardioides sp. TaxID=35761 RepID=UPI0025E51CF0|nr:hypothetical protein [Nocardioides sp.]
MKGLEELLDRATDAIESHLDHADVLVRARRRRTRQRGFVAGAVAGAAVAAVVVSLQVVDGESQSHEVPPASQTPSMSVRDVRWDPRDVADLPPADADVAPLLPDVLEVPDVAPRVEDDPVDAAVLSVDDGADVLLLGTDGRWRCVVVDGKTQPPPVLSPRGTRVAVTVVDGVVMVDLTTGVQVRRPLPDGFTPSSRAPVVRWVDEQRLLLSDGEGAWLLDADRGVEGASATARAEPEWTLGLPELDPAATGWEVGPVAALADGSALLRVTPPRPREPKQWWVVRWDPASVDLALAATVESDAMKHVSFASDLLGDS